VASSSNDKYAARLEPGLADDRAIPPRDAARASKAESAAAVAQYLADMTGQLESMARAAKLELVAYLLSMARTEADSIARTWPEADDPNPH
jgi:hypothetical protein